MLNNVSLVARVVQAPALRTTNGGTNLTTLRVAIQRPRKNGEDQGADFIDVTVFGNQAAVCKQYLTKGRKIAVQGRLHHSEWDSENGRRQKLEVIARSVEFLDAPRGHGYLLQARCRLRRCRDVGSLFCPGCAGE